MAYMYLALARLLHPRASFTVRRCEMRVLAYACTSSDMKIAFR